MQPTGTEPATPHPAAQGSHITLAQMSHLNLGKRTRLHRLLYQSGPANGTLLFLPIDQGLEHGPRDFFVNPASADPEFELKLAQDGRFTGIALQYGLADKYLRQYAGQVPLILKLNGKTEIPAADSPLSPVEATVEDAVRIGADAIGYTLYVGSARQDEDFRQFAHVRDAAERYGMPVIVWAYPRGEAIKARGGQDGIYAIDYAVRVAMELGADVVKFNFPQKSTPEDQAKMPKPYNTLDEDEETMVARVIATAGRTFTLVSGGEHEEDAELLRKAHRSMAAGATGLIFGRNIWQRPRDAALEMAHQFHDIMKGYPR